MFAGLNPNPYNTTAPMNPNPYNTQPQPATLNIDGTQIPAYWGDQFKQTIDAYHQLQWDPLLQNLIQVVSLEQQKQLETVDKAKSDAFSLKAWDNEANKAQNEYIKQRCLQIKKRNQKLLVKLLNTRELICSQMYMYRVPSKPRSLEMEQISQKIRDIKYQVKLKYSQLKVLKMNKDTLDDQKQQKKRPSSVDIPLIELKKGAQVLEKETLKIREEFLLMQKLVHGEKVL